MSIEFCDKNLEELYNKGYSKGFLEISKKTLRAFMIALSMAESAASINDVLNPPPFKGLLHENGLITLMLYDGWELNFFLEIFGNNQNKISVVSLILSQNSGGLL